MEWSLLATLAEEERRQVLAIARRRGELRTSHPAVDRLLIDVLAQRVRRLSDQLVEALYSPVEARVARRLLHAAERWGGAIDGTVVPLTQEDLAGMAGTTRPTVSRVVGQFVEMGLVTVSRGRVALVDTAGLKEAGRDTPEIAATQRRR